MSLLTFRRIQISQMEVKVGANGSNYPKYSSLIQVVWKSVAGIFSKGCWGEQKTDFSLKGSIYHIKMQNVCICMTFNAYENICMYRYIYMYGLAATLTVMAL
jgi:hypothetical protein